MKYQDGTPQDMQGKEGETQQVRARKNGNSRKERPKCLFAPHPTSFNVLIRGLNKEKVQVQASVSEETSIQHVQGHGFSPFLHLFLQISLLPSEMVAVDNNGKLALQVMLLHFLSPNCASFQRLVAQVYLVQQCHLVTTT